MEISELINWIKQNQNITLHEAKELLDKNKDSTIAEDEFKPFSELSTKLGTLRADEKVQVEKVLRLLELAKKEGEKNRIKPPQELNINGADYYKDPLITEPTRLPLRLSPYKNQTINLQTQKALKLVTDAIASKRNGETDIQTIVRGLWENRDPSGKEVFRMEELFGVFKYLEGKDAQLKTDFYNAMGAYIEKNYSNSQQVFDSLLGLIQSTDWNTLPEMEEFAKGLAENMSDEIFVNKSGVIGNYDGTQDANVFGSLALIKDDKGNFNWIEHTTADAKDKTKYTVDAAAPEKAKEEEKKTQLSEEQKKKLQELKATELKKKIQDAQAKRAEADKNRGAFGAGSTGEASPDDLDQVLTKIGEIESLIEEFINKGASSADIGKLRGLLDKLEGHADKLEDALKEEIKKWTEGVRGLAGNIENEMAKAQEAAKAHEHAHEEAPAQQPPAKPSDGSKAGPKKEPPPPPPQPKAEESATPAPKAKEPARSRIQPTGSFPSGPVQPTDTGISTEQEIKEYAKKLKESIESGKDRLTVRGDRSIPTQLETITIKFLNPIISGNLENLESFLRELREETKRLQRVGISMTIIPSGGMVYGPKGPYLGWLFVRDLKKLVDMLEKVKGSGEVRLEEPGPEAARPRRTQTPQPSTPTIAKTLTIESEGKTPSGVSLDRIYDFLKAFDMEQTDIFNDTQDGVKIESKIIADSITIQKKDIDILTALIIDKEYIKERFKNGYKNTAEKDFLLPAIDFIYTRLNEIGAPRILGIASDTKQARSVDKTPGQRQALEKITAKIPQEIKEKKQAEQLESDLTLIQGTDFTDTKYKQAKTAYLFMISSLLSKYYLEKMDGKVNQRSKHYQHYELYNNLMKRYQQELSAIKTK